MGRVVSSFLVKTKVLSNRNFEHKNTPWGNREVNSGKMEPQFSSYRSLTEISLNCKFIYPLMGDPTNGFACTWFARFKKLG